MVCVHVPLLLKWNVGVLFGVLRRLIVVLLIFSLLWICNYVLGIIYKHRYISVTPN
jgi:hypothetical protein